MWKNSNKSLKKLLKASRSINLRFFSWNTLFATIFVFFTILLFPLLFNNDIFDSLKLALSDFRLTDIALAKINDASETSADTNIVLINNSLLTMEGNVALAEIASNLGASVIGFHSISANPNENIKDLLGKARGNSRIIIGYYLNPVTNTANVTDPISNKPLNKRNDITHGYTNLLFGKSKEHSSVREFFPRIETNQGYTYSFASQIIKAYNLKASTDLLERNNKKENINYRGNYEKFYYIDAIDLLSEPDNYGFVKGKIVLVGKLKPSNSSHSLNDMYFTPLNEKYTGRSFPDMYGLVINANIISMVLNDNYYNSMPGWLSVIIAFIICYANIYFFTYVSARNKKWYEITSILMFLVESVFFVYLTFLFYSRFNYELKLTVTIYALALAILLYEAYNDSLVPLVKKIYNKFFRKVAT